MDIGVCCLRFCPTITITIAITITIHITIHITMTMTITVTISPPGAKGPGWTQPLDILSAASQFVCYYLSNRKGAWATQPLEQILDSELLLCELGVGAKDRTPEIDTSEIIVDVQWHVPMDFSDICQRYVSCQLHVAKDCHCSSGLKQTNTNINTTNNNNNNNDISIIIIVIVTIITT